MAPRLHGMGFPCVTFPKDAYLANGVEHVPEVVTGLAGNARLLREWLAGPIDGVDPCAPMTPHGGTQGHDHSGGIMGTPMQFTLASQFFGLSDMVTPSDLSGGTGLRNQVRSSHPSAGLYENDVELLWIPGSAPANSGGAYERLALNVIVYASAACRLWVRWTCNGVATEQEEAVSGIVTGDVLHFGTKVWTTPGRRNFARIEMNAIYDGHQADVTLMWLALHQTATAP